MTAEINSEQTSALFKDDTFPWPRAAGCPLTPPPQIAAARKEEPIKLVKLPDGSPAWLVTKMQDVKAVLSSPHFSASPEIRGYPFVSPARAAQMKSHQTFATMDPPEHGKFRRTLTKEFMMKRMEDLRPFVQSTLDQLLDEMEAAGPTADFIEKVALSLPSTVISIMLGVPYEDHAMLQEWSSHRMNLQASPELVSESAQKTREYIGKLLREREQNPGAHDDLLSRMAVEWVNTGEVTHEEAVRMGALLYLAGHETTANQIGLGLLSLLQHPEQRAALAADPSLVRGAVEEMLRFHSIIHLLSARVATADVEIGGQMIRKGEGVFALLQGANHDPEIFPDPERFDIKRETKGNSHVAFAFGIHQCLGQPLARLELQIVFETIFKRFPNLRLAVPFDELQFKHNASVFGLVSLPVAWQ